MILHGRPLGGGAVLGIVHIAGAPVLPRARWSAVDGPNVPCGEAYGEATETELPAASARAFARRQGPREPADIILVAADGAAAANASITGGRVVGFAYEADGPAGDCAPLPGIAGVPDLLRNARNGCLALLDADRGILILDPSPEHLAHFQAEREHIAPRYRIHLDHRHLVAHTLDLRPVHVVAHAVDLDEVRAGVEEGADEVLIPLSAVVDAVEEQEAVFDALSIAGEAAAGKPLILHGGCQSVPVAPMMRAAARAQITYALPLSTGAQGFVALRNQMAAQAEELIAQDVLYLPFPLAATATRDDETGESIAELGINRVIVPLAREAHCWNDEAFHWLEELASCLRPIMVPLIVEAPDEVLEDVVKCGASGLIVPPGRVQSAKTHIREMGPF